MVVTTDYPEWDIARDDIVRVGLVNNSEVDIVLKDEHKAAELWRQIDEHRVALKKSGVIHRLLG